MVELTKINLCHTHTHPVQMNRFIPKPKKQEDYSIETPGPALAFYTAKRTGQHTDIRKHIVLLQVLVAIKYICMHHICKDFL